MKLRRRKSDECNEKKMQGETYISNVAWIDVADTEQKNWRGGGIVPVVV
jgi:hypothetical protein